MYIKQNSKQNMNDPFAAKSMDNKAVTMEVNGLTAILNMPKVRKKQKDAQGKELAQGLPEYNQRPAFVVDEYPACPDSWMHGNGKASSYFVPILPDHGMWLDFTRNTYFIKGNKQYDVAVVPSIQGINPLTGMKSDPIRLEQYKEMCPKHQKEFKQDRFCEDCKFKWHPQNYLSSNNGSSFWIDGFRSEDGQIRQWYFTEDECKGIAAQVIGNERVFAIGLAFYLSKKPKPPAYTVHTTHITNWSGYPSWGGQLDGIYYGGSSGGGFCSAGGGYIPASFGLESVCDASPTGITGSTGDSGTIGFSGKAPKSFSKNKTSSRRTRGAGGQSAMHTNSIRALQNNVASTQKMLEIGAGAKIAQQINPDPQELDYWQEEPEGFIYINYCDIETAQKIIAAGTREELNEGFLSGLNTK